MKTILLLLIVVLAGCTTQQETTFNYCEEYGKAEQVKINFIGSEKIYTFNNISVDEKTLLESCKNGY